MTLRLLSLVCLSATLAWAQNGDKPGEVQAPPPSHLEIPPSPILSVDEALATFRIAPGLRLEVVAADPLIGDPVAMTIGPDGRIWVAEMRGYMPNPDGHGEDAKVGTIAVLEDTDGDGRMDKRTVFLDGLVLPRALALVGDGLLVAEPPHLWFCRDTDGDGKADEKTEIANDYGSQANVEHTANGLLRAMDNWIYSANHTVRFRYEGNGKFTRDLTVTRGQWGIAQDDTGRLFHNNNSDPLRADLVPAEYFRRNPNFANPAGANVQSVKPSALRLYPARVTPGVNRGYKSLDATGRITEVTAACGPVVYRGTLFPAEFQGNGIVPEPSANLVKRILLDESDGRLTGRNAYTDAELLASTDERFRPVNAYNGPDGAIYIVDLYRGILQHRIYLTSYLRKQIEDRGLDRGLGLGRIYRLVPADAPPARERFARIKYLAAADSAGLVAALGDPNGWTRDTAQRLLVERRTPDAVPLLREAVRQAPQPLARLHALWSLEGLGQLDEATTLSALADADPRVCAAAIRLSEPHLATAAGAALLPRLAALLERPERNIRLQLALSLGACPDPAALDLLRELVLRAGDQPYLADAVVSGLAGRENAFFFRVAAATGARPETCAAVLKYAAGALFKAGGRSDADELLAYANLTANPAWARQAVLDGLAPLPPEDPRRRLAHRHPARGAPRPARPGQARRHARGRSRGEAGAVPNLAGSRRPRRRRRRHLHARTAGLVQPRPRTVRPHLRRLPPAQRPGPGGPRPRARQLHLGPRRRARPSSASRSTARFPKASPCRRCAPSTTRRSPASSPISAPPGRTPRRPVAPATVARIRAETAAREEPWTDDELREVTR